MIPLSYSMSVHWERVGPAWITKRSSGCLIYQSLDYHVHAPHDHCAISLHIPQSDDDLSSGELRCCFACRAAIVGSYMNDCLPYPSTHTGRWCSLPLFARSKSLSSSLLPRRSGNMKAGAMQYSDPQGSSSTFKHVYICIYTCASSRSYIFRSSTTTLVQSCYLVDVMRPDALEQLRQRFEIQAFGWTDGKEFGNR